MLRIRRRAQDEVARSPIVNPHGCPIGAEQAVRAVAEDVEAGGQVQRRREALAELIDQLEQIALQILCLTQAEQLDRREKRVGHLGGVRMHRSGVGRLFEADGQQPDAIGAARERHQERGARAEPRRQFGDLSIGVGDERRRASRERLVDERGFIGAGHERFGGQCVQAEPRRRLQRAVARVEFEQQRARPARRLDRLLMQMWEHVVDPGGVHQEGQHGRGHCARAGRLVAGDTLDDARGSPGSNVLGHRAGMGADCMRLFQSAPSAAARKL